VFGFATASRIAAAAACAAVVAAAGTAGAASSSPARALALDEIRALAAIATAGRGHAEPRCRTLAARAADLGAAAVDALVDVDKSRELHPVGAAHPALEADYQRVADATRDARHAVAQRAATCPGLLTPQR
jgi:hypothetical protein